MISLKRTIAILLLLCTLLLQLAACKNGNNSDTDTSDSDTEAPSTQIDIPETFQLTKALGFIANGNVLSMTLAREESSYELDVSSLISTGMGTRWAITTDEAGENVVSNKKINLSVGENVFYVKVSYREESFMYKAVVNYRSAYTVEFYSNCDEYISTQIVDKGTTLTRPNNPTRSGYTFLGWYLDGKPFSFSTAPTKSCTLIAHWDKNNKNGDFYASETEGIGAVKFESINAGLRIVWKDYADISQIRPAEVTCILTQKYGNLESVYEIILKKDGVAWKYPNNTPSKNCQLTQGDGGDWTLSLKNLPETSGPYQCTYTLTQKPLSGNYTTMQSGSAVTNTVNGYIATSDATAKLTTRNSRLYDAAGNLIVFTGVVSANLNFGTSLDNSTTPAALKQLKEKGCNVLRMTVPIVASGDMYYVYQAQNGNFRTGDYKKPGANPIKATQANKQKVIDKTFEMVDAVTSQGLYIILDWAILTSNPYEYVEEASEYFGIVAEKYANNPYVLYEICNEPADCSWSGSTGIKAYAERLIDVIRGKGSDGIIIVAPRGASNYISMSPTVYGTEANAGDDPIRDPLDDDRCYNVAYTQHPYAYENAYSDSNGRNSFGWRIRDAYKAGLTIICTEMSPMAAALDEKDTIGYDFVQMNNYMRMFQEYDISYCYFKYYINNSTYDEWCMLKPKVNPTTVTWTRDDLTTCGQWYYDLITGTGIFVTTDYTAKSVATIRDSYSTTFSAYGLASSSGASFFTVFPTFAISGSKSGSTYFFKVSDSDSLQDIQYELYCSRILKKVKAINASAVTGVTAPKSKATPMQLTYNYNGKTCTLKISYGQNTADGSFGIFFTIQ